MADSWILDLEKYFDVWNCSKMEKFVFVTFMLSSEAEHFWRMEKRLLKNKEPLVWDNFKEVFFKKYYPRSVYHPKESEFKQLRQSNMKVADYETKFTKLSRFASNLIFTEEQKVFHFQEGLSPFFKDSLFLHKLETYSEVVESALIAKKSAKELQRYREQHKRGRSYYPQGVQTQKRPSNSRDKAVRPTHEVGKDKVIPCSKCGKQHGGIVCYKEIGAYFNCGERGHFVRDYPRTKDSQAHKPDSESLGQGPKGECFL